MHWTWPPTMLSRRALLSVVGGVLLGFGAVDARAVENEFAHGAAEFIESLADRAIELLAVPDLPEQEREQRFRILLGEAVDTPTVARFVLGGYWRQATEEERGLYLKLFEDLLVKRFAHRFAQFPDVEVRIDEVRGGGANDVIVMTEIRRPEKRPVRIGWRVWRAAGDYKIVDVLVMGVSMAVIQRSVFTTVIHSSGGEIEGLLQSMRKKIIQLSRDRGASIP